MAKKKDARKALEELEKIYVLIRDMSERHEREMKDLFDEVVKTFKHIRDENPGAIPAEPLSASGEDPMFDRARNLVTKAGKASTSYLQRKLQIGYAHAAKLMDMLEEAGVIGPAIGALPREVYRSKSADAVEKLLKQIASQMKKQKPKKK